MKKSKSKIRPRSLRLGLFLLACFFLTAQAHATCTSGTDIVLPHNLTAWDYATWGGTQSNPVACDIVVPSGHDVFLSNAHIYFEPDVSWTIETGARMVTFRCTFDAKTYQDSWEGMRINGDETLPSSDPAQGQLFLKECTLNNAMTGVRVGSGYLSSTDGGGILVAIKNTFVNPGEFAIELNDYGFPNASRIKGNTFQSDLVHNERYVTNPSWGFINLEKVLNVRIENNDFFNSHAPSNQLNSLRGIGITANQSSFFAKNNDFYWLYTGVWDEMWSFPFPFQGQPNANRCRITNNRFFNDIIGVHIKGNDATYIDNNEFIVNDNNIQVLDHLNSGVALTGRSFTDIFITNGTGTYDGTADDITVANNTFRTTITVSHAGAEDLNVDVMNIQAELGTEMYVHENDIDFDMPVSDPYPNGQLTGMEIWYDGQVHVECNEFDFDDNSDRWQVAIKWIYRTVQTAIGSPSEGAGNTFLNFTDCSGSQTALRGGFGTTSAVIDYYELVGTGNLLPAGCASGVTVVDITGTGSTAACSFPAPPTQAPGSIVSPPALPAYPTSKMALTTSTETFSAYPSVTTDGAVTVDLPAESGHLQVMNLQGQVMQQWNIDQPMQQYHLDLNALAAGTYLVTFVTDHSRHTRKVIRR